MGFWREETTSYQGCLLSTRLIAIDVELDPLAEAGIVRLLHCEVTLLPPSGESYSAWPPLNGVGSELPTEITWTSSE